MTRVRRESLHEPYQGSIPDPDWDRYVMPAQQPGAQVPPVGDPTRWGAQDSTNVVLNAFNQSSAQIIQITTHDPYSRAWSVLGALTMPVSVWDAATAAILASLVVTMGVGQTKIVHKICLWSAGGAVGSPGGLCYQQDLKQGGPYLAPDTVLRTINGVVIAYQTRAFAAVGALVGQSISIVAEYGTLGVNPELPAPAEVAVIATPYAAGEKL